MYEHLGLFGRCCTVVVKDLTLFCDSENIYDQIQLLPSRGLLCATGRVLINLLVHVRYLVRYATIYSSLFFAHTLYFTPHVLRKETLFLGVSPLTKKRKARNPKRSRTSHLPS